jgi:hypothetical protein
MGTRLRLKSTKDLSGYSPEIRKIFVAMQHYGLLLADNGTDMYVSGTMDAHWDNDVLNPAFHSLLADDFEVLQRGWRPVPTGRSLSNEAPRVANGPHPGAVSMTRRPPMWR